MPAVGLEMLAAPARELRRVNGSGFGPGVMGHDSSSSLKVQPLYDLLLHTRRDDTP